jgi:hypothetical protein
MHGPDCDITVILYFYATLGEIPIPVTYQERASLQLCGRLVWHLEALPIDEDTGVAMSCKTTSGKDSLRL